MLTFGHPDSVTDCDSDIVAHRKSNALAHDNVADVTDHVTDHTSIIRVDRLTVTHSIIYRCFGVCFSTQRHAGVVVATVG